MAIDAQMHGLHHLILRADHAEELPGPDQQQRDRPRGEQPALPRRLHRGMTALTAIITTANAPSTANCTMRKRRMAASGGLSLIWFMTSSCVL